MADTAIERFWPLLETRGVLNQRMQLIRVRSAEGLQSAGIEQRLALGEQVSAISTDRSLH
jgi:hypothetical protein